MKEKTEHQLTLEINMGATRAGGVIWDRRGSNGLSYATNIRENTNNEAESI